MGWYLGEEAIFRVPRTPGEEKEVGAVKKRCGFNHITRRVLICSGSTSSIAPLHRLKNLCWEFFNRTKIRQYKVVPPVSEIKKKGK
jgi:hypothetical protein